MKRFDHSPRKVLPERSRARPPVAGRFGRRLRARSWRAPVWMPQMPAVRLPRAGWLRFRRSRLATVAVAVVGLSAFGSATWAATRSPLLDVDHIEVTGVTALRPEALIAAAGLRTGEPMVAVDPAVARVRLEAVPWVDQAQVERVFPNRVRIQLSERPVAAVVARPSGGFALLDGSGRVLADQPERPPGVPEVVGAGEIPAAGHWLEPARPVLAAVMSLPEPLRRQVGSAGLTDGAVGLRIGDREVRFGPPDNLAAKAAALEALLNHLGNRAVAFLDVRVPGAPVVGPLGPPAPAGASPATTPAAKAATTPAAKPAPSGAAPRD